MRVTPVMLVVLVPAVGWAQHAEVDWPRWGGPAGNFTAPSTGLADTWPEAGPPRVWDRPLGAGSSALIVDDGRVVTMFRDGEDEVIIAMAAEGGRTLWEHRCPPPVHAGIELGFGKGPNATPLIAGNAVYTLGFGGLIHALDKVTGEQLWAHDVVSGFGARPPQFGYAASPVACDGKLIIPAGGQGHGVMAFDLRTGSVVWRRHDYVNSYASPQVITLGGNKQVVVVEDRHIVGLDPADGRQLWHFPHYNSCSGNVSTPLWNPDGTLFLSSSPHAGSRLLKLVAGSGTTEVTELWSSRKFKVAQSNMLRLGDMIVGCSGTTASSFLSAVDARTGNVLWRERGFPLANAVHADGKLFILDAEGNLSLATASPRGLTVHSKLKILKPPSWTVPTLVGDRLYLRDNERIVVLDVGED